MASVAIHNITKAFGATEVIHGVDIGIGEREADVRPSDGCGKARE